jgi:hypothetical protein
VREWLHRITTKRSGILLDNRLANDLDAYERETEGRF